MTRRPANDPRELQLLCAGAVQGLVRAVQGRFQEQTSSGVGGRFGAVGAMKEALMAGAPCDVLIVTAAMLRALAEQGAPGSLRCTQVPEIATTPGLALAGALPEPYGLATVYSAGISKTARDPVLAAAFVALLCGAGSAGERRSAGFEAATP